MSRLTHTRLAGARLLKDPRFKRAPARTTVRLALWALHCVLRRPATVTLKPWRCRIRLPAGTRLGTTGIYLFRGAYEPELRDLEQMLPPGGVFIDVGASVGIYSVVASALVGKTGTVLAFEPGETTYPVLCGNALLSAHGNIRTFKAALSDESGTAKLYHVVGASLYSFAPRQDGDDLYEHVQTIRLDDFADEQALQRIDCLKIDVEGAEPMVLRGARDVITRFRPTVVFEASPWATSRMGGSFSDSIELLRPLGYEFFVNSAPMTEITVSTNIVARPAEKIAPEVSR